MQVLIHRMHVWSQLLLGRRAPGTDSERRYTRLGQAVATGLAGKAIAAGVSLISIPLTVRYLGAERYGLWITISSMLAWLNVADLGLGNSLINALAEAYGKDDKQLAQRHVASVFWLLIAMAGLLVLIGLPVIQSVNWATFFNVKTALARAEVMPAIRTAFFVFVLQFPLSIVPKILTAHQEMRVANAWAVAGNLLALLEPRYRGRPPWRPRRAHLRCLWNHHALCLLERSLAFRDQPASSRS